MATLDDIDTKSAVRKFLERRTVADRENEAADSADEVSAVLEAVAQSFLLHPQAALSFVVKAKNTLQQIITTDIEFVDYLLKALRDVDAPSDPVSDVSDLVEAQTALIEVDRAGRVSDDLQSFGRYRQSIDRFLDKQLARTLKRRRRGEFERTGNEARQDLFRALLAFGPIHALMAEKLRLLQVSIEDFQSVDLTKIVSTRAVSRVRSSLKKVSAGLSKQTLSKTSAALELLAGRDALRSISNARDVYDPTIETGVSPTNRDIRISSQMCPAIAVGTSTDVDLTAVSTPWDFDITVDPLISGGTPYSLEIPFTSASGRHYVKAAQGSATYDIIAGKHVLYVAFDGVAPPPNEERMVRAVALPTGTVTLADVLTALNDVGTGLIDGTAVELGAGRILIYGDPGVTGISILSSYPGTFDISGNYVPADESVHAVLGFSDGQESGDPNIFSPAEIVDLIKDRVSGATVSLADGAVQVSSGSEALLSSLSFGALASSFGFSVISTYTALPEYLELIEDGVAVDPESVGVFVGSVVQAPDISDTASRNILSPITRIEGTHLFFDLIALPRCTEEEVRIDAPIVRVLRTLLNKLEPYVGSFANDAQNLQRVLSPALSKPTLAQINDANRVLGDVRDRLQELLDLLQAAVVRDDRTSFGSVAAKIVASLQERGLDRSLSLLQSGQFTTFFGVDSQSASTSSHLMKAVEEVGRNDYASTTIEEDIPDLEPRASTPDDGVLTGEELTENEEQL